MPWFACGRGSSSSYLLVAATGIVLMALPILAEGPTGDPQPSPEGCLKRLLTAFAAMPGLTARFEEERHLALLRAPLVNRGELLFAPPNRLLWRVDEPTESAVLLEGGTISVSAEGEVRRIDLTTEPAIRAVVDGLLLLLSGNLDALAASYEPTALQVGSGDEPWSIRLEPRLPTLKQVIRSIEMTGRGRRLASLRIVDARDDEVRTRFFDVNADRSFTSAEIDRLFRLPSP